MTDEIVSRLKVLARRMGRAVKSVEETADGLEVLGVNGRSLYLDAGTSGGRAVSVRAYESGGDEIRLGDSTARTDSSGWEGKVMRVMKEVLGGREVAIAERVAAGIVREVRRARMKESNRQV